MPANLEAQASAAPGASTASRWVRRLSYATMVGSFVWLLRILPLGIWMDVLSGRIDRMGTWGIVVFAVVYVVAALLFIPGAALTLAAGALFGLVRGTLVVSVASTVGAALGYLIGRHVARDAVVKRAARSPAFAAIDRAIGEGGWRVVGLLRLSPALPYSLGNYLYGLTAVRFVPYVLASWVAMLPGTFMYVYLGHAGRAGLEATSGSSGKSAGEWALLAIGLLSTIVVTVYVTKLAKKAMRQGAATEPVAAPPAEAEAPARRSAWATLIPALLALVVVGTAVAASANQARLRYLLGPPPTKLTERFADTTGTAHFDHSVLDGLLHEFVDDAGYVDFPALATNTEALDGYLKTLASAPIEDMGRDERLTLLLNAYNAFTLRLILDNFPLASIRDIPGAESWDAERWLLAGSTYSLNQLEHEQIRPNFKEPRIHFALVCAAIGCPPLRSEAYATSRLEEQLQAQAVYVHTHPRWLRYEAGGETVQLTALYDWYGGDFEQVAGTVEDFAARYVEDLAIQLEKGPRPDVEFLDYDWALNSKTNRR